MKSTPINLRIQELVGEEKPFAWASRIGIPGATFNRMWNEGIPPKADTLEKIAGATGVSIDWLLLGRGPKLADERGHGKIEEAGTEYKKIHAELDLEEFALVPRYDVQASAGHGAIVQSEQIVDHLAFKRKWLRALGMEPARLALITARGDSMYPTITDGDLLLVDTREGQTLSDGVYVLRMDGNLLAKRLQRDLDGSIVVRSDNPAYLELRAKPDQVSLLEIVGRVVWAGGKM